MLPESAAPQATPLAASNESIIKLDSERQISTNFFWRITVEGQQFDMQTTVRDSLTDAQIAAHMAGVSAAAHFIVQHGGTAKSIGEKSPAQAAHVATNATPAPAQAAPIATSAVAQAAPASAQPQPSGDSETFRTIELLVTEGEKGKSYKVTGGKYTKYGVTAWPEVLAPVFDLAAMTVGRWSISGYEATIVMKDGKPQKVSKLTPIA